MKTLSPSLEIDALRLNRLLRKSSVDTAVFAMKVGVAALTALLLLLLIQEAISGFFSTRGAIAELRAQLSAAQSSPDKLTNSQTNTPKQDYGVIVSSKIFGQLGAAAAPVATSISRPVTPIALDLIGTFLSDGQMPYAIIEDKKKHIQDVFVVNNSIFDQAKLVSIMNDRVEIERDGKIELLKLDDSPDTSDGDHKGGVSSNGENQFIVDESELDSALQNLPLLLTQARAVPYFKDGRPVGLRMFAIRTGSLFEKVGLKNGDILKSINGNSLADLSQAMKLFEKLKEERSLSVSLERNSQDMDFRYQIR